MVAWTQIASLTGGDTKAGDIFGSVVAVDGNRALVAAFWAAQRGAVYVFEYQGTNWAQTGKLVASDGLPGDYFSISLDLSGDRAVASTNWKDHLKAKVSPGAVYVFELSGGAWKEAANLTVSGPKGARLGVAVSIDTNRVLAGAPVVPYEQGPDLHNLKLVGHGKGTAYIFERGQKGWSESAKLTPSDSLVGDYFGHATALHGDRAVIGALYNSKAGKKSGSAYVFEFAKGTWQQAAKLAPSDHKASDLFGAAVALDGNRALVASPGAGAGYLFERTGTTWKQVARLTAPAPAGTSRWLNVALDGDNALLAFDFEDAAKKRIPQVHLYRRFGQSWLHAQALVPAARTQDTMFGTSVALSGDRAVVAEPPEPESPALGSALVFERQCATAAFSIASTDDDQFEPNGTFDTATPVTLSATQRKVTVGELTLPQATDLDFFHVKFKGALGTECPGGGASRRYGIGGPFFVDYEPGSLIIEAAEERCRALDLEFYDAKRKLKKKVRTETPVRFNCPGAVFSGDSCFVRVSNPESAAVRYRLVLEARPSSARIGGKIFYDPPRLLRGLFPDLDRGDPPRFFDMRRLIDDLTLLLEDGDVFNSALDRAQAGLTIADLALDSGRLRVARRMYRESLDVLPEQQFELAARAHGGLVRVYRGLGKKRRARVSLKQSARVRRLAMESARAADAMAYAATQAETGNPGKALRRLERVQERQRRFDDRLGQVRNLSLQTSILVGIGEIDQAHDRLAQAQELLAGTRHVELERELDSLSTSLDAQTDVGSSDD